MALFINIRADNYGLGMVICGNRPQQDQNNNNRFIHQESCRYLGPRIGTRSKQKQDWNTQIVAMITIILMFMTQTWKFVQLFIVVQHLNAQRDPFLWKQGVGWGPGRLNSVLACDIDIIGQNKPLS